MKIKANAFVVPVSPVTTTLTFSFCLLCNLYEIMGTEFSGPMHSNLTLENETLKSTIENILMEVEVKEEVEVGFNVFWCVVSVDGS